MAGDAGSEGYGGRIRGATAKLVLPEPARGRSPTAGSATRESYGTLRRRAGERT